MTWESRYRLKHAVRTSLMPWAILALAAALIATPVIRWIDHQTSLKIFNYSVDGARAVLGALASSMLTFIVFVLSGTLILVQLASGQLTPRIIGIVFAMPRVKITLGLFIFTFTFTVAALGRVEDRVPDLLVGLAVILNLACIIGFFQFVQQLASGLRPTSLMKIVADRGLVVIEQVYPMGFDPALREVASEESLPRSMAVVEFSGRSGTVMAFSAAELVRLARDANCVVELVPQVGDFIAPGDPLFRITSSADSFPPEALRGCVAIGDERTLHQDPRFVFRILVDIASRALSPAINDPTTAVLTLDQIHHLLLCVGKRHLDEGRTRDSDGKLRLVYGTPDWADYVILGITEIRHYGDGSLQVTRRLRAMLEHLMAALHESRRPALQAELDLLVSGIKRRFPDEADRNRANTGDFQGVGGSDS